jgi:hypothetical protein
MMPTELGHSREVITWLRLVQAMLDTGLVTLDDITDAERRQTDGARLVRCMQQWGRALATRERQL